MCEISVNLITENSQLLQWDTSVIKGSRISPINLLLAINFLIFLKVFFFR